MTLCIVDGLPVALVRSTLEWVEKELITRGLFNSDKKPDVVLVTLRHFETTIPEQFYYGVTMSMDTAKRTRVCLIRINPVYLKSVYEFIHRLAHEATHAYGLCEIYARDIQEHAKEVMKYGHRWPSSDSYSTSYSNRGTGGNHETA